MSGAQRKRAVALGVVLALAGGLGVGLLAAPSKTKTVTKVENVAKPVAVPRQIINTTTVYPTTATTGVPSGTTLTAYSGPTTITSCGVTINAKNLSGGLVIRASNGTTSASTPCVTITNSLLHDTLDTSYSTSTACQFGGVSKPCGPVVITDSEIAMPVATSGFDYAIKETNVHGTRVYVHGTNQGVNCDGYCEFHDSLLVADHVDLAGKAHMDGFSSNGNGGRSLLLDHNTLFCQLLNTSVVLSGGGCSGDLGLFGDFAAISNVAVNNNLFQASPDSAYCSYTGANQPAKQFPTGDHISFTNNVWGRGTNQKCATFGAVPDWGASSSNVWCNNRWDSGEFVLPSSETCGASTTTTTVAPTTTTTTVPATTTTTIPATTTTGTGPEPTWKFQCTATQNTHVVSGCTTVP